MLARINYAVIDFERVPHVISSCYGSSLLNALACNGGGVVCFSYATFASHSQCPLETSSFSSAVYTSCANVRNTPASSPGVRLNALAALAKKLARLFSLWVQLHIFLLALFAST